MGFLSIIAKFLGGGVLDRALDSVDRHIDAQTDREKIKADIVMEHVRHKADFMNAGGKWLMLLFAVPLAFWYAAVIAYSVFWCQGCIYPQPWSIAALPAPLDQWSGGIVVSIFGVVGLSRFKR